MTKIGGGAAARGGWLGKVRLVAVATILTALASCGGNLAGCAECAVEDFRFYSSTWLSADPGGVTVNPGEEATALVTVGWDDSLSLGNTAIRGFTDVFIVPPTSGVTLTPAAGTCVIPSGVSPSAARCKTFRLRVSADAIAAGVHQVTLSAIWSRGSPPEPNDPRTIERVETFQVTLVSPPPVVAPDFQIVVNAAPGSAYATVATLPVTITRVGGFAEAVTLEYMPLASGVGGAFVAEPVPTDSRSLTLRIPARFAGGGRVDLRVRATAAGGRTRTLDFPLFIEPLLRLELQPTAASLSTAAPLRVEVGVTPGTAFRTTSLGTVGLSLVPPPPPPPPELPQPTLPPGVTHQFLPDATPVAPVLPIQKVWRTLQLVTNGVPSAMGQLTIRATAVDLPADVFGVKPFVDVTLDLSVQPGQLWQFVGNNLTYGTREADTIGIGMQSDNRPAFAWLESSGNTVYMRRFDGTTFAASPPRVDLGAGPFVPGLRPTGGIDDASFALSSTDTGHVAFTYEGATRLALGRAGRAAVEWSIGPPLVVGNPANGATPRVRSPRVATGPADAVVVAYIQEANASTTEGGVLQVAWAGGSSLLFPLPTALSGGSLNASPTASVKRHATALALRADGNPWVAWIEQPTNRMLPDRLWLRGYNGTEWDLPIPVPTAATGPVGSSVQLLVEPSGMVVVAWLESGTAQLKVARYDPAGQSWTQLGNTNNASGALNVTASFTAADVHLARQPDGRLLVTWTEGGADQRVWIKRLEANGAWTLVGTTVSPFDRYAKTPRIVSDANNRLYVAWATYAAGQNPGTLNPYAEIDVAQWIFP